MFMWLTAFSMAMSLRCTTVLLTAHLSALSCDLPGGPPGVVNGAVDHARCVRVHHCKGGVSLLLVLGLLARLGCLTMADQSIVDTSMIGHLPHNAYSKPLNEVFA